ncbi:MAG: apolipoprotein N-acyltransferase [Brevinema sp.]
MNTILNKIHPSLYFLIWVVLTSLSFSTFDLPFIWVSYVPLIYVIHKLPLTKIAKYGFLFGYLYYLCTLYWLIAFHEISAFFVFPIYALYTTMAMIFTKYITERFPKIRLIVFPILWLLFEILRSVGFFGFRWNTPADALWKQLIFLQSADIIGSWGVSFIVLMVNSCIAEILLNTNSSLKQGIKKTFIPFYLTLFIFLCNLAYGISASQIWKTLIDTKLHREKVTLIQPNRPGHSSWYQEGANLSQKYLDMMRSVSNLEPDLILQTEIMLSTYFWESIEAYGIDHPNNQYNKQFIELAKELDTPVMITHFSADDQKRSYNSATLITYTNESYQTNQYNKIHIVPFGEWIPGSQNWEWFDNLLSNIGAAWASPGKNFTIFTSKNGLKFALLICFEDIYAILGRLFVNKGVQYFVNATNDGWAYRWKLGAKAPLWQHLANTTHTAVSLRRSIARSVNTGVTAVVDPMGRMDIAPIKEYQEGIYTTEVPAMPIVHKSLYVLWGWMIEYIIFFIGIGLTTATLVSDKQSTLLKRIL